MSIGRQAAHGVAWYMGLGVSTRVITLISTFILARYFAPDAFGAVVTAQIAVLTTNVFTSFAFGQYLIAKRAPAEIAAQAAIIHVGLGIIATAVVVATRGPLGELIGAPEMGHYVLGYAVSFLLLDRIRNIPERLMMRALRFRALATINGIGELVYIAASLATVFQLHEYALMICALARSLIMTLIVLRVSPRREWLVRTRLQLATIRDLFMYGLPIMISSITDNATTKWDNLIVARLFGPGVMGNYQYAYTLADMPISNVAEHIGEVLMPSFSRMEDDQRRTAVVRAANLMGLVVAPLGVGLAAVAPTVIAAVFKPIWAGAAPMLQILGVAMVFRPMTWSAIAYAQAVQRTGVVMVSSFMRVVIVLSLVAVGGVLGGPEGACYGAGAGFALHSTITIITAGRATDLPVGAYLVAVGRPLLPCIPMFLGVVAIQHALAAAGMPLIASLAIQIVAGAVLYVGAAFVLLRSHVHELIRLGREFLRRRRA